MSYLPENITLPDNANLPDGFWDSIYDWLQDNYGAEAGKYAESYGVEITIRNIRWEEL